MSNRNEEYIISSLITNGEYCSKVFNKIKPELFDDYSAMLIFKYIQKCINSDSDLTFDTIKMLINGDKSLKDESQINELHEYLDNIKNQNIDIATKVLLDETKAWAKLNSFRFGLNQSVEIIKKSADEQSYRNALSIIEESFNVNFEDDDYSMTWNDDKDRQRRVKKLKIENTIRSGFTPFDDLTGGLENKTLLCFLSPTGHGKTLSMAFLAACYAIQGYNIAVATLEISCEKWLARVDANLLDLSTYDMTVSDEEKVYSRFKKFDTENTKMGQIEVKQFSDANCMDLKMWLRQLYVEKKFTPDILFIDYIGIMSALYVKDRSNTYINMKEISREVRQKIGIDMDLPIVSAVQSNRAVEHKIKEKGKNVEITSADTADSYAIPQNLDTFISQVEIKQGIEQHLTNDITSAYLWKLIKSRNYVETGTKTMVGVSKSKQRLYDINFGNLDVTIINNQETQAFKELEQKENEWFSPAY